MDVDIDDNADKNSEKSLNNEDEDQMDVSEDELMVDDVAGLDQLNFDFEAYPIDKTDRGSIVNLLTQIFLRADIDLDSMASMLIKQSPFGCVYRVAEEYIEDEDDGLAYGVLSMLALETAETYAAGFWNLLKARVRKYASDKKLIAHIDELSTSDQHVVGLLLNERMLHFPTAIAAPAFASLKKDLKEGGSAYRFTDVILILKIRVADTSQTSSSTTGSNLPKKKMSKAQKRREAANAIAESDVIFDNSEEELLFKGNVDFEYFQYPVQSELEKDSKFNSVVVNGTNFRPYRRVCLLNNTQFQGYINLLSTAQGL